MRRVVFLTVLLTVLPLLPGGPAAAADPSQRTLVVAVEVDRDGARLLRFTTKDRAPFTPDPTPVVVPYERDSRTTQIELVLSGPGGARQVRRVDAGPLCLTHGALDEPHVAGDTIRVHRDVVLAEFAKQPGVDRLEIAFHEYERGEIVRRSLGTVRLVDDADDDGPLTDTTGAVFWPEDFDDPDVYRVWGDESEIDRRINVVIVPDGYVYEQKTFMEQHAQDLVDRLASKKPYHQHQPFFNYILVYAYSTESGTDECDCGIVKDTAMGTRFPDAGYPCGDGGNRCLYYGGGCDVDSSSNIADAEMRAPARDETVVMVNTTRYGGCAGSRAVYAARRSDGPNVAAHEIAHILPGLADEYGGPGCGTYASEINTSMDPVNGAWPEWIPDLGPPKEGGQYYNECIYRSWSQCAMRDVAAAFCWVCSQHYSLTIFGHPRVEPTAPVESSAPASPLSVEARVPVEFRVTTRLGVDTFDDITWTLEGPGFPEPTVVATQTETYTRTFDPEGDYVLRCEVVAATEMIKPEKNGPNVDVAVWNVEATKPRPLEVSGPGSPEPLRFTDPVSLVWENAAASGSTAFNLYRGEVSSLAVGDFGSCLHAGLGTNAASDPETPPAGIGWTYLVSGTNEVGEGTLGGDSADAERPNSHPCP